ncbi:mannosyl-oligosaccharide alpha-1,2-mannosidase IA-like [Sitophilus oryzae]|uniref:alpha-1,2-Mannosidase n=1 Tax=Sitophilus oryzae TaxID=7048 RepID=A0A6J2YFK8_SITOR|nr:mannosyl-oligosaccharide alpha-1,2-mannosidase IA-like [Sitophilus oryzae]
MLIADFRFKNSENPTKNDDQISLSASVNLSSSELDILTSLDNTIDKGTENLGAVVDNSLRRLKVKQMMKHAWDNYVRYAWGKNELRPVSKRGHNGSVFGSQPLGASILDGLDTLYMMGMMEEFKQARDWVAKEFDVNSVVS